MHVASHISVDWCVSGLVRAANQLKVCQDEKFWKCNTDGSLDSHACEAPSAVYWAKKELIASLNSSVYLA